MLKFGQGRKVYQDNQLESWNVPVVIKNSLADKFENRSRNRIKP